MFEWLSLFEFLSILIHKIIRNTFLNTVGKNACIEVLNFQQAKFHLFKWRICFWIKTQYLIYNKAASMENFLNKQSRYLGKQSNFHTVWIRFYNAVWVWYLYRRLIRRYKNQLLSHSSQQCLSTSCFAYMKLKFNIQRNGHVLRIYREV